MKIGIITFHYPINYGAVLQAYALSCYVKSLGHEAIIINYVPVDSGDPNKKRAHKNLKDFLQEQYIKVMARYSSLRFLGTFKPFLLEYLPIGERLYRDLDALKAFPPACDAYVCGSDQIWNPHGKGFDPAYFLTFTEDNALRISYAASFGTPTIAEHLHNDLGTNLSRLDHISVREKSGVDIVKNVSEKECVRVLDPTLLLEKYTCSVVPKYAKGKYIFVYRLQQSHSLTTSLTSVIKHISGRFGERVINVSPHPYRFFLETGKTVYPTPGEWVGLIEQASFVITNSFHGTAFAILNKKPFISFPRVAEAGQNGRMQELLADMGLENRYITPENSDHLNSLLEEKINWNDVDFRLNRLRGKSYAFLGKALDKIPVKA